MHFYSFPLIHYMFMHVFRPCFSSLCTRGYYKSMIMYQFSLISYRRPPFSSCLVRLSIADYRPTSIFIHGPRRSGQRIRVRTQTSDDVHWRIQGGGGALNNRLVPQSQELAPLPLGNPGSATDCVILSMRKRVHNIPFFTFD